MNALDSSPRLDTRFTQIGDLANGLRRLVMRALLPLAIVLGAIAAYIFISGRPGAAAFGELALAALVALIVWERRGIGLPLMPMFVLQHLIIYGLPILVAKQNLEAYPEDVLAGAGVEVLVFLGVMTAAWRMGMGLFRPSPPVSHALNEFHRDGSAKLRRLGFALICGSTAVVILQKLRLLEFMFNLLPRGSAPIVENLMSATAACGFFLVSMLLGARELSQGAKIFFWSAVALNCYVFASSFLLSTSATLVFSVAIGLFWSAGKIPWRYLLITGAILSFLNVGKITMRERYWTQNGAAEIPNFALSEMGAHYAEWIEVSYDAITMGGEAKRSFPLTDAEGAGQAGGQTIFDRINNLQNLLFVINAVEKDRIPLLYGATYAPIPKLFIPRVLWPDKPRTHEGQVILNVHFGRQDLASTFTTYIAWGLLPEAYGNFGRFVGSALLGAFFGLLFAWVENLTARKLVISLEGFLSFVLFLGLANSFEMVATVAVTSVFQSLVTVGVVTMFFVHRTATPTHVAVSP